MSDTSEHNGNKDIVAFLGPAGTFTHAAADRHFGEAVPKRGMSSLDEVFAPRLHDVAQEWLTIAFDNRHFRQ